MKRNIFIFLFLLMTGVGVNSCTKEALDTDCHRGNFGTITVVNSSTQPYDFYIDDQFQETILANTSATHIHIKSGFHRKLYVKETNGAVITPAEETKYMDISSCNDYNWQIP